MPRQIIWQVKDEAIVADLVVLAAHLLQEVTLVELYLLVRIRICFFVLLIDCDSTLLVVMLGLAGLLPRARVRRKATFVAEEQV